MYFWLKFVIFCFIPCLGNSGLDVADVAGIDSSADIVGEDAICIQVAKVEVDKAEEPRRHASSWFGDFAHDESTFSESGKDRGRFDERGLDGWEPQAGDPFTPEAVASEFFHESPSDGAEAAWQTHYPALQGGVSGDTDELPPWDVAKGGSYFQPYQGAAIQRSGPLRADFFDDSVDNVDSYGRKAFPKRGTDASLVAAYTRRLTNASLLCTDPGCTGSVTMTLFNATERAKNCIFSFGVHATDFDSALEVVEYIKVNNKIVKTNCTVDASGCDSSEAVPLRTCVIGIPLDQLVNDSGKVFVEAKISQYVDQCPYTGFGQREASMLAGVAKVVCMIGSKQGAPLYPHTDPIAKMQKEAMVISKSLGGNHKVIHLGPGITSLVTAGHTITGAHQEVMRDTSKVVSDPMGSWQFMRGPLKCAQNGCSATLLLQLMSNKIVKAGGKCMLTVRVNQTDFDGKYGSNESLSLTLKHRSFPVDIVDGATPCASRTQRRPHLTALSGEDVTEELNSGGTLTITMNISTRVDDCPSQGFLLDGLAEVNCTTK